MNSKSLILVHFVRCSRLTHTFTSLQEEEVVPHQTQLGSAAKALLEAHSNLVLRMVRVELSQDQALIRSKEHKIRELKPKLKTSEASQLVDNVSNGH